MEVGTKIRPLAQDDWAVWRALWQGSFDHFGIERPEEIFEITFARLLDENPMEFSCLLAETDGEPKGMVHFGFYRHCHYVRPVCYLQDLFVREDARLKGLGKALIEAVSQRARARECPYVYWLSNEGNQSARALYDKVAKVEDFVRYVRRLDDED